MGNTFFKLQDIDKKYLKTNLISLIIFVVFALLLPAYPRLLTATRPEFVYSFICAIIVYVFLLFITCKIQYKEWLFYLTPFLSIFISDLLSSIFIYKQTLHQMFTGGVFFSLINKLHIPYLASGFWTLTIILLIVHSIMTKSMNKFRAVVIFLSTLFWVFVIFRIDLSFIFP